MIDITLVRFRRGIWGHGAAFVTVRVYVYQSLVYELSNVRLEPRDLWCVAFADWPSGQMTLCEATGGGYRITPDYPSPPAER